MLRCVHCDDTLADAMSVTLLSELSNELLTVYIIKLHNGTTSMSERPPSLCPSPARVGQ